MKDYRSQAVVILVCTALLTATLIGCHGVDSGVRRGRRAPAPIQAIWVTRWDYRTPGEIRTVMENCRRAGFNTVLFQVRGNGTVLYRSKIEPWANELGGHDPGFDPLAVACREAHRRGLSLHAWVNVIPGWHGKEPPSDRRQLYHAHPDWFWRDARGQRQPLGWYSSLNPCFPEVRQYLVSLMHEIVSRYPVDGLHLDYVRFPNEWHQSYPREFRMPDYPRDPRTLAYFRHATGHTPESAPAVWNQWRTEQVTQVVRAIRAMMQKTNPRTRLSAAVGPEPDEARRNHFQDARAWLAEGLLDAIYPMNYTSEMQTFQRRVGAWSGMKARIPVVMGIMCDKRDAGLVSAQVNEARRGTNHFAAFAYNALFERLDRNGRRAIDQQSPQRAALRKRIIPELRRLAVSR